MYKNKFIAPIAALVLLILPQFASALEWKPEMSGADQNNLTAQAYIIKNITTGLVLIKKNSDQVLIPASLTKLLTALVVMDKKPNLSKSVTMSSVDQIVGQCKKGGVCIKSKPGVKFSLDGLFHAALIRSANNAASALSRSSGLSQKQFVKKMNQKVKSLGAIHSVFYEPTGMDPRNRITAEDYTKIITAAYAFPYLRGLVQEHDYNLVSINNPDYTQKIKTTDKLLLGGEVNIIGSKTGYLTESRYNYASLVKSPVGNEFAIVILGEPHLYSAFNDTKTLLDLISSPQFVFKP
ncbi:MAG: serine hydrolase [Candidatus Doudnabacteria bacterium]